MGRRTEPRWLSPLWTARFELTRMNPRRDISVEGPLGLARNYRGRRTDADGAVAIPDLPAWAWDVQSVARALPITQ